MKRLVFYHFVTLFLSSLMSNLAYGVKFDIKKGFVYEEKEIEEQKVKAEEEKLSKPMVKVVRLFNEDNKITDPVLQEATNEPAQEIQFVTMQDETLKPDTNHEEAARQIANLNGTMDWVVIEKNLLEVESKFGIRSMPVVQFSNIEKLDKNAFSQRVEFLEFKLGIEPESKQISAIPVRLIKIQQQLNSQTESVDLGF
jgi:hypothetical protein